MLFPGWGEMNKAHTQIPVGGGNAEGYLGWSNLMSTHLRKRSVHFLCFLRTQVVNRPTNGLLKDRPHRPFGRSFCLQCNEVAQVSLAMNKRQARCYLCPHGSLSCPSAAKYIPRQTQRASSTIYLWQSLSIVVYHVAHFALQI